MYSRYLKRALDILLSLAAIAFLSPLLACVAILIRLEDGGPVLFRQQRIGRHGRYFPLLKLRSMPVNTGDVPSHAAAGLRITRIGKVIRRLNIDELPQLMNILRGEMSIVGPRPALPTQTQLVELRRVNGSLACIPGLTGLAQVNAYDGMPVTVKAEWDGKYGKSISLPGDMAIILRTVRYLMSPPPTY